MTDSIDNVLAINDDIQQWISHYGTELKVPVPFFKLLNDLHWACEEVRREDGSDEVMRGEDGQVLNTYKPQSHGTVVRESTDDESYDGY